MGLELVLAHARGTLGYWVGVPYWGRGYATEAAEAVLAHAFGALGLHRVQATHLTRNPASCRVMEKLGMRVEGSSATRCSSTGASRTWSCHAILVDAWRARGR